MRSKRMPTRERGRPARTTLARPRPSPPPGSTGNGARTLLRPSPCRCRRQGGRVPHRRETERHATGVHAGGTPALPGGPSFHHSCCSRGARRRAGCHIAGKLSVTQRECMRAGRPRSRVALPPITLAARRGAAGGRVPHRRETERHATGVHAGETPALPGGTSSCYSCCSQGRGGLPGAPSQETERHVAGVHAGGTPALPGGTSSRHRFPLNSSSSWPGSVTGALQV